jgi:hypothetical protein
MRVLCFAMLQGTPAIVAPSIQDSGLNALKVWDRIQADAIDIGSRAVEAYDNIRFVYQVAQQLRRMERETAAAGLTGRSVNPGADEADATERAVRNTPGCGPAGFPEPAYSSISVHSLKGLSDALRTPDERGGRSDAIREGSRRETGFRPTLSL